MSAPRLRTIKIPEVGPDDDGYVALVRAVVCRAVADALGATSPTRHVSPTAIQQEAFAWLAEEDGLVALLELGGFDAEPIVRAIQQSVVEEAPHGSTITA
jgi:hypothetical protein